MTIAIAVRVVLTVARLKRRRLRAFTTEVKKDRAVLSLSRRERRKRFEADRRKTSEKKITLLLLLVLLSPSQLRGRGR